LEFPCKEWRYRHEDAKGFLDGCQWVTEHIELLQYLLQFQKNKKIYKIIFDILLDLKNAFGEVHPSLIRFALRHHHVPDETTDLILSQYSGFFLNITSKGSNLKSPPIHV